MQNQMQKAALTFRQRFSRLPVCAKTRSICREDMILLNAGIFTCSAKFVDAWSTCNLNRIGWFLGLVSVSKPIYQISKTGLSLLVKSTPAANMETGSHPVNGMAAAHGKPRRSPQTSPRTPQPEPAELGTHLFDSHGREPWAVHLQRQNCAVACCSANAECNHYLPLMNGF